MTTFASLESFAPYLNSMADFPELPRSGYVTIGELNGRFEAAQSESIDENYKGRYESVCQRFLENHIPISKEFIKTTQTRKIPLIKTAKDELILQQPQEGAMKALWMAWMDSGVVGSIDTLERIGAPTIVVTVLRGITNFSSVIRNAKRRVKGYFFETLKLSNKEMINAFAPVRDWSTSWVRAMSWHPRLPRIALAFHDDSVKIFINEETPLILPVFKAPEQNLVSCMSWHPYVNELAVGVETGFVIWTLYPPTKESFPTSQFISTLSEGHAPVTAVDYSKNGQKILTSSAADPSILIWSLCNTSATPLFRISGGGVPRALWSPNAVAEIFSNTPSTSFRLWCYQDLKLKPKCWVTRKSRVDAFSWHPSGHFVSFVSDSILFSFKLSPASMEEITPVFDLAKIEISQKQEGETGQCVGGNVVQIEWDPTGMRLAVLFSECNYIAVLSLTPGNHNYLLPCGLICGREGEYPVAIAFQKDYRHGALLTIAWSSERIQYFPILFSQYNASSPTIITKDSHLTSSYYQSRGQDPEKTFIRMSPAAVGSPSSFPEDFKLFSHDKME